MIYRRCQRSKVSRKVHCLVQTLRRTTDQPNKAVKRMDSRATSPSQHQRPVRRPSRPLLRRLRPRLRLINQQRRLSPALRAMPDRRRKHRLIHQPPRRRRRQHPINREYLLGGKSDAEARSVGIQVLITARPSRMICKEARQDFRIREAGSCL